MYRPLFLSNPLTAPLLFQGEFFFATTVPQYYLIDLLIYDMYACFPTEAAPLYIG